MNYRFKVYNPCWQIVDVAADWGFDKNNCTHDLSIALSQKFKIAAVRAYYNKPWVASYDPAAGHRDLHSFDLVLISDVEYYTQQQITEWCAELGIVNYLVALGGKVTSDNIDPDRMIYRHYWIPQYTSRNTFVDTSGLNKPFLFDALLGARRPNRDYIMMGLTKTGLLDRSLVTYRDCFPGAIVNNQNTEFAEIFSDTELQWPYVSANLDPAWEVAPVVNNQISFVTPVDIYSRTYYSIVAETLHTGNGFFFSEKSIKAFFAQRIFVLFGNQYHLQRLRDLGFKTFGAVIDESYDNNPLDFERFAMALQQLELLAGQDPAQVQQELQPVLEHNYQRLFSIVAETQAQMIRMVRAHTPVRCWS
jgi:hypothetical protein